MSYTIRIMPVKLQRLRLLYTAHGIFMLASIMLVPLFAVFATEAGASILVIGYLGSIYFATKTIGVLTVRVFSPSTHSAYHILFLSYIVKGLCWGGLIFSNTLPIIFIVQALLGLAEGFQSPAFRTLTAQNIIPGKEMAQFANWEVVLALTGIVGTSLGGFIATKFGFDGLFIVMSILAFIAALLSKQVAK